MKKRATGRQAGLFDPVGSFDTATGWRKWLVVVIFLVLVLAVLMPELVFQDKIFLSPDTKAPLSFKYIGRESYESGTNPLWNPYLFCGMPSYPSLSYTPLVYPLSFIVYILHLAGFPEMTWLLVHFLMAGIGVFLLMRSFSVRSSVSLIAAAMFMMMPNYIAAAANGHGSQACAIAYMPFALLFTRKILGGNNRIQSAALLAITLGFQMLRGHIQISFYTMLLVGFVFILESGYMIGKGKRREVVVGLVPMAAAFIFAFGISAVLLLPVREYAAYSIRGGGGSGGLDYGYATSWSLHPREIATFIFPWASGYGKATYWGDMPFTDYPNYIGVCAFIFSVAALFIVKSRWKWFLFALAVLATILSFGRFFPVLYNLMFEHFPYFNKFRVPVMILIVQQLALVALAGLGIEEFLRRCEGGGPGLGRGREYIKYLLIASSALLVLVLVGHEAIGNGIAGNPAVRQKVQQEWIGKAAGSYAGDLGRTVFFITAFMAVLFLSSRSRIRSGAAVLALALLAVIDLYSVDYPILHPDKAWNAKGYALIKPKEEKESFGQPTDEIEFLKKDESFFRIFPVPAANPGRWGHSVYPFSDNSFMMSKIFSLGGYHAAKLKNYQNLMDLMFASFNRRRVPRQILDMLNAKYFVSIYPLFKEDSGFPLVFQREKSYVYRNEEALDRVFFVGDYKVMDENEALGYLISPDFDPSSQVLLQKEPTGPVESAQGSRASIVEYGLNSFKIEAYVEKPCIMVISEIFYPDWRMSVDGVEREILQADYCLRAVYLGPGRHDISMWFYSSVLHGSLIASVSFFSVAFIAAVFFGLVPKRRS